MNPKIYLPVDLSGLAPSNLITNEIHTVQECNFKDYYIIVPNFFPFYEDNIHVELLYQNTTIPLRKNEDYDLVIPNYALAKEAGKPIYSAISLHNHTLDGKLVISYQSYGGNICADRVTVLKFLADKVYNLREVSWNQIVDKPAVFPPSRHFNYFDDIYGQDMHVFMLQEIIDAIQSRGSFINTLVTNLLNTTNPEDVLDDLLLNRHSPTMTGHLVVVNDISNPNYIAPYSSFISMLTTLQNAINTIIASLPLKINNADDTFTGELTLYRHPVDSNEAATYQYTFDTLGTGSNSGYAPGDVMAFTDSTVASSLGFIRANGAKLPISLYPSLYNAIGHSFDQTGHITISDPTTNQYLITQNCSEIDFENRTYEPVLDKIIFPTDYLPVSGTYASDFFITKNKIYFFMTLQNQNDYTNQVFIFMAPINPNGSIGTFTSQPPISGIELLDSIDYIYGVNVDYSNKPLLYSGNSIYFYRIINGPQSDQCYFRLLRFSIDTNGFIVSISVASDVLIDNLVYQNGSIVSYSSLSTNKKLFIYISSYEIGYQYIAKTIEYDIDEFGYVTNGKIYSSDFSTLDVDKSPLVVGLKNKVYRFDIFSVYNITTSVYNNYIEIYRADILDDGSVGKYTFYRKDNLTVQNGVTGVYKYFCNANNIYIYCIGVYNTLYKYPINIDESIGSVSIIYDNGLTYTNGISIANTLYTKNSLYLIDNSYDTFTTYPPVFNSTSTSTYSTTYMVKIPVDHGTNDYSPYYQSNLTFNIDDYSFGTPWIHQYKFNNEDNTSVINAPTLVYNAYDNPTQYSSSAHDAVSEPFVTKNRIHIFVEDFTTSYTNYFENIKLISYTVDANGDIIGQIVRDVPILRYHRKISTVIIKDKIYIFPSETAFPGSLGYNYCSNIYVADIDTYGNIQDIRLYTVQKPNNFNREFVRYCSIGNKIYAIGGTIPDQPTYTDAIFYANFDKDGELSEFNQCPYSLPNGVDKAPIAITKTKLYVFNIFSQDVYVSSINEDYTLNEFTTITSFLNYNTTGPMITTKNAIYYLNENFDDNEYNITKISIDSNDDITLNSSVVSIPYTLPLPNYYGIFAAVYNRLYVFSSIGPLQIYKMNFNGGRNDYVVDFTIPYVDDPDYFRIPNLNDKIDPDDQVNYYIKT